MASGLLSTIVGGYGNTASGDYSTAMGNTNTAMGQNSTAMGAFSTASGINSFASGYYNTAHDYVETVLGLYATIGTGTQDSRVDGDRLFVVGNGTADDSRSNALNILKNANTTIGGSLTINGNGNSYAFPTVRGTSGHVLTTNGSGGTNWTAAGNSTLNSSQFVFVEIHDGMTDSENATALLSAYSTATSMNPSSNKRIVVIVPPGRYNMGTGAISLNTEYIDLVGLTTNSSVQYIYGVTNGNNTGVLMQSANNVRIENLTIHCARNSGNLNGTEGDPSAYLPNSNLSSTYLKNCIFTTANTDYGRSMRTHIIYSGTYIDCRAGDFSFGESGSASGNFINCIGGNESFASAGTANGKFTNCEGGYLSFGGTNSGTSNGTFTNCKGGDGSFGGLGGTASGSFYNCIGGTKSFGGSYDYYEGESGDAPGYFSNCIGGNYSFGGDNGTAKGTFLYCVGGDGSFGAGSEPSQESTGGKFFWCRGGSNSFTTKGNPTVIMCIRNNIAYP